MPKTIYKGYSRGLFSYNRFKEFMRDKKAERVLLQEGEGSFQVWQIDDVTVLYTEDRDLVSNAPVKVSLFGREDACSKIEQMILSAQPVTK